MPLSRRIWSPAGVVDALAASTRNLHPSVLAVVALTTEGTAAGTNTSHGSSRICSSGRGFPPGKVRRDPPKGGAALVCLRSAATSSPPGACVAPCLSETAITLAPASWKILEAQPPTLPNPWMTTVLPSSPPAPWARRSSRVATTMPLPVALSLPCEPCRDRGCIVCVLCCMKEREEEEKRKVGERGGKSFGERKESVTKEI